MTQNIWNNQVTSATVTFTGGAFNVGTDVSSYPIQIGTGNATKSITIGSASGNSSLGLHAGTGSFSISGLGAVYIDSASILELNSSNAINIGNAPASININIGNSLTPAITVGHLSDTSALRLFGGTGESSFSSNSGTFNILTGTGDINIGTDAQGKSIQIGNTTATTQIGLHVGTGDLQIGIEATDHITTIGSLAGQSSFTITAGLGNFTISGLGPIYIDSASVLALNSGSDEISIGNDTVSKNINIGTGGSRTITTGNPSSGTSVLQFLTGGGLVSFSTMGGAFTIATGTGAIDIGTDAHAKTITIGNAIGATSITLNAGTGAINIGSNSTAHTTTVGTTTGAASSILQCGTGALSLTTAGALYIDSVSVLELNSSGGVINIGNDAVSQAINIGTGANDRTITIGNDTGATSLAINLGNTNGSLNIGNGITGHQVIVGSTTGNAATTIQCGNDTFSLQSTTGSLYIDSAGVLELNSASATISFGNKSGTQNINIGTGASNRTITIGNVTGESAISLECGTGAFSFTTAGALYIDSASVLELNSSGGTIGIGNDAVAQNINIGTGAASRSITIGNDTNNATSVVMNAGTGTVNIGSNAVAHTTTVGTTTGAAASTFQCGTGAFTITGGGAVYIDSASVLELNSSGGTIVIGNDAVAQNINIGTGAASRTITIGNDTNNATSVVMNAGTGTVNIGSNAVAHTTTVGTTTGAAASTFQCGTGAFTITGGGAVYIDSASVLELNSSGGTIGIGNDAVAQNINIGTGAASRTITIGNTTDATNLVLKFGSNSQFTLQSATATCMTAYNTGELIYPKQPAFYAIVSAYVPDVTGAGASYTIAFDQEIFDQGLNYDNSTYTFIAPKTAKYHFDIFVDCYSISSAMVQGIIVLITSNGNQNYDINPAGIFSPHGLGYFCVNLATTVLLDAGDSALVRMTIFQGASNSVTIRGDPGGNVSIFSGYLAT